MRLALRDLRRRVGPAGPPAGRGGARQGRDARLSGCDANVRQVMWVTLCWPAACRGRRMEWQPTRWTPAQLEERRLAAARLLRAGVLGQAEIARRVGVSRASVTRWKRRLEQEGVRGMRRRASPGRPSYLRPA